MEYDGLWRFSSPPPPPPFGRRGIIPAQSALCAQGEGESSYRGSEAIRSVRAAPRALSSAIRRHITVCIVTPSAHEMYKGARFKRDVVVKRKHRQMFILRLLSVQVFGSALRMLPTSARRDRTKPPCWEEVHGGGKNRSTNPCLLNSQNVTTTKNSQTRKTHE